MIRFLHVCFVVNNVLFKVYLQVAEFKLVGRVVYVWNKITVNSPLTDTSLTHLGLVLVSIRRRTSFLNT